MSYEEIMFRDVCGWQYFLVSEALVGHSCIARVAHRFRQVGWHAEAQAYDDAVEDYVPSSEELWR